MTFTETSLRGAYVIDPASSTDERGSFTRTFCREEYRQQGLDPRVDQRSSSFNLRAGTLRGMHLQVAPHVEAKTVRCVLGALHDVIVDLRVESATYCQWFGVELSQSNRRMLYIPPGFAHGFMTLLDDTEVDYQMSGEYHPESARGYRWDDPAFGIAWPRTPLFMSERDRRHPDLVR